MKQYKIEVTNKVDHTDIYISGDIIDDAWRGLSWGDEVETYPQDIREILNGISGDVDVYVSSGGGDLFAGVAISNILKRYKGGRTRAIIDGLAASAASIIAFGCDEIEMPSNAYLMIHKPSVGIIGNADDLLKWADTLDEMQKGLVNTYLTKAKEGVDAEQINTLINSETWFTGNSVTEFFNVNITDAVDIKNDFGERVLNYAHTPKALIDVATQDETEKKREVENALAMY